MKPKQKHFGMEANLFSCEFPRHRARQPHTEDWVLMPKPSGKGDQCHGFI